MFFSITATIASFSSASIPSAAIVLLFTVLSALDIPNHYVTLLFAIDWIAYVFLFFFNLLSFLIVIFLAIV